MDPSGSTVHTGMRRILWLSFLSACVGLVVVAYAMRPESALAITWPDLRETLPLVLTLLAGAEAVMSFVLPPLLRPMLLTQVSSGSIRSVEMALQQESIIRWALAEGVAVLGFIQVALGAPAGTMIPFAGAALALLVVQAPRDRDQEAFTRS